MVMRAMYAGVSGLKAEGEALGVMGDNIANMNTVGFKSQRAVFEDVLGQSMRGGSPSAGSGVRLGEVQQVFTQGSMSSTGVATDIALSGDGFFVVHGSVDGVVGNYYTRAGQFVLNNDGYLVSPSGLQVQGYSANPDGTLAVTLSPVSAPTSALEPRATERISVAANLNSGDPVPALPWSAADPGNTSNFSTTMTVYDSLGGAHSLNIYFNKTGENTWAWHALASGDETNPPAPGMNVEVGTGTMAFTTTGALESASSTMATINFQGATAAQTIELSFGQSLSAGGTGVDGITQFASPTSVSSQSQDGYASGDFAGVAIDGQGMVMGLYSNGQRLPLAQLAVAKFRSNQGLARAGQTLWSDTRESGAPAIGMPGTGGRGVITAGALEGSNVDISEEFVGLIQHQRAFSANSKTITTADEMLQVLMSIKR